MATDGKALFKRRPRLAWLVAGLIIFACSYPGAANLSSTLTAKRSSSSALAPTPTATRSPSSIPAPKPTLPPVVGPEPSYRVGVFYYPWYQSLSVDGFWRHWEEGGFHPPLDISSDYYPVLGAYSVADEAVVAQHFSWLRRAGVGVIASSWWGQGSREDRTVPLLLDIAERYGIKVAFHIEPYVGRSAERLVSDIQYLYRRYGSHPAFFRTNAASRWSPDDRAKGLFFVWGIEVPDNDSPPVDASYWRDALDAIHTLPDGALVIVSTVQSEWVDGGHFDGLYNYVTLHLREQGGFAWARSLPPDAWYVPSVIPGFSARRIGYPDELYTPRRDGATYSEQWGEALGVSVEPAMVMITSFNEWHEGTQIEPAAVGVTNGGQYTYRDYGALLPEGYLDLTQQWVNRFSQMTWPEMVQICIHLMTTSDWTVFHLAGGADWLRPDVVRSSPEATEARIEGYSLILNQPLARAEDGGMVEMLVELLFAIPEEEITLNFQIDRGYLGNTRVELANCSGGEPIVVKTFVWSGINPAVDSNTAVFQLEAAELQTLAP